MSNDHLFNKWSGITEYPHAKKKKDLDTDLNPSQKLTKNRPEN